MFLVVGVRQSSLASLNQNPRVWYLSGNIDSPGLIWIASSIYNKVCSNVLEDEPFFKRIVLTSLQLIPVTVCLPLALWIKTEVFMLSSKVATFLSIWKEASVTPALERQQLFTWKDPLPDIWLMDDWDSASFLPKSRSCETWFSRYHGILTWAYIRSRPLSFYS